jgi:hypothetical protein
VFANTVREATSNVVLALWKHLKPSPFHIEGGKAFQLAVSALLNAFIDLDLPPHRQKVITLKFLCDMFKLSGAGCSISNQMTQATTADLAIMAFFFAMHSCKHTMTSEQGQTKTLNVGHVLFCDKQKRTMLPNCTLTTAEYVMVKSVDQKNGTKMDLWTQCRMVDPIMCPIKCLHSLFSQI